MGVTRALRGLRRGDQRELVLGLALAIFAYMKSGDTDRELLFRKKVPEGSAIVIHHRRRGDPKIEVIKPQTR